jgi:hypothetical protein
MMSCVRVSYSLFPSVGAGTETNRSAMEGIAAVPAAMKRGSVPFDVVRLESELREDGGLRVLVRALTPPEHLRTGKACGYSWSCPKAHLA